MAIVLPCAFIVGSHWGNAGIAAAWMIGFPIVAVPVSNRVFKKIELRWIEFFRVLMPAITGCLLMSVAVLSIKHAVLARFSLPLQLAVLVLVGALSYCLVAGALSYPRRHALRRAIGMLRTRRTVEAV